MENAESKIVCWLQKKTFPSEMNQLSENQDPKNFVSSVAKSSPLSALDPFLDQGILRVGGRLRRANIPESVRYPIIIPRKGHITDLIIQHEHKQLGHVGANHVLASLRQRYWIIGGMTNVRNVIHRCVTCRRYQGPLQQQKMADLPGCRVDDTLPPFSYTGVDYFGPFVIRDGRKYPKFYGVLFTCMVSRCVHLEIASSLDADSFLHALRRFVARRGKPKELHSDNGTNFVGSDRELKEAIKEMDHDKLQAKLSHLHIEWCFNPPTASHMGGSWERLIRSVRKILNGLISEHGSRLDIESFHTLLCEVEAIMNSRPLTCINDELEPLAPSNILTGRTKVAVPPPGNFVKDDLYLKRRWRRVQYLTNVFWSRWRNEYLLLQQKRQKWTMPSRNLQINDIVLLKDESMERNHWPLGRVIELEKDSQEFVRAVKVKTQQSVLRRPVSKLVLLLAND